MHSLRQNMETACAPRGIDLCFVNAMVLKTLAKEPGISGAQLARRTLVTAQSMNGMLRSMESAGAVVREPHPENRRTDCWYMTASGSRKCRTPGRSSTA